MEIWQLCPDYAGAWISIRLEFIEKSYYCRWEILKGFA